MLKDYLKKTVPFNNWTSINAISVSMIKDPDALAVWSLMECLPHDLINEEDIKNHFSMTEERMQNSLRYLCSLGLVVIEEKITNGVLVSKNIEVKHQLNDSALKEWINE